MNPVQASRIMNAPIPIRMRHIPTEQIWYVGDGWWIESETYVAREEGALMCGRLGVVGKRSEGH